MDDRHRGVSRGTELGLQAASLAEPLADDECRDPLTRAAVLVLGVVPEPRRSALKDGDFRICRA
jgi:hypothetical protein